MTSFSLKQGLLKSKGLNLSLMRKSRLQKINIYDYSSLCLEKRKGRTNCRSKLQERPIQFRRLRWMMQKMLQSSHLWAKRQSNFLYCEVIFWGYNNMFDFLNKLSHSHQSPAVDNKIVEEDVEHEFHNSSSASDNQNNHYGQEGELSLSILPKKQPKNKNRQLKSLKRANSIVAKMQERPKFQLKAEMAANFNVLLKSSQKGLPSYLQTSLKDAKSKREKNVYIREMSRDQQEYLEEVSHATKLQNNFLNQQIADTLNGVLNSITKDIEDQKFQLQFKRKKAEYGQQRKLEALKLIKMQQSQLQDKIGQLSVQFNEQTMIDRRAKEILDKNQFQPQNVKTKLAQEFVKELQRQKQEKKMKIEEMKEKKRETQLQIKFQQQIQAQRAKQQKHLKLMQQFVEKQKAKKEKEQESRVQQLNYQQFIKQFKQQKPLYVKKQEQFKVRQKQEKLQRYEILRKQQAKYDPLDAQILQIHEQKYLQLKKQDRERKQAEMQLAKYQQKLREKQINQKAYKGRFRYIVLKQMADAQMKKKEKQAEKQAIIQKKQAYSLQVKERYKPSIDPNKRSQLIDLINSHKSRKRKYLTPNRVAYSQRYSTIGSRPAYSQAQSQPDPKMEGKRYHRIFKQYIRQKIDRGQIKENEDKTIETIQPRPPDYLKQLREKYSDRIPSQIQRLNRDIQNCRESDDYRMLLIKASEFEGKAKQREKKIRNAPHKPEEEARLEQEYLCAIKAKIQLINNID